ncbi:MAG: hypothetical protein CMC74_02725 [Flavobacteriaceae bacterium]|nr:hypothetical protein [Flavobacteriaceae bacterium]|tara:strand:- start:1752 stop:2363 length:612 start_codon:yes stop_codon:yes gene_type:complete
MNTKTDFKDFVDQYVIDEEFKMLECPFTDYGWQGFQNSLVLTLNFEHFNQLYLMRPNYKIELFNHYYDKGWIGLLVLKIVNKANDCVDYEITLKGLYESNDDINCYDITELCVLKQLNLNHLDLFQKLMFYLESINVQYENRGNQLSILHTEEQGLLCRNVEEDYYLRAGVNFYDLKQNTLEEIKSYLFPELVREETLRTLID